MFYGRVLRFSSSFALGHTLLAVGGGGLMGWDGGCGCY